MNHLSYRLGYSLRQCLLHFRLILPQVQKAQVATAAGVGAPASVVGTNLGGCEEEWIPKHRLKKTKKSGAVTGDAETSGGEASGEGPRRHKGSKLTPFALCSRVAPRIKLLKHIDKGWSPVFFGLLPSLVCYPCTTHRVTGPSPLGVQASGTVTVKTAGPVKVGLILKLEA